MRSGYLSDDARNPETSGREVAASFIIGVMQGLDSVLALGISPMGFRLSEPAVS